MENREVRLIDANVLIKDLTAMKSVYDAISLDGMIKALKEAETIDPESLRAHGKWILGEPDFYGNRKPSCSVCGEYPLYNWADYARCKCCPNCGAKMDIISTGGGGGDWMQNWHETKED